MPRRFLLVVLVLGCSQANDPGDLAKKVTPDFARPIFVTAPAGDVGDVVVAQTAKARAEGAVLLVYEGAEWCEPCKRFREAVGSGQLDKSLAPIWFLEFDADRDDERLEAAGYSSPMVPLFARPKADGTADPNLMIAGVPKTTMHDPAPALVPRIAALLVGQ